MVVVNQALLAVAHELTTASLVQNEFINGLMKRLTTLYSIWVHGPLLQDQ
jgi:mannitol/fructose-specific phosphotransferase system IIA component